MNRYEKTYEFPLIFLPANSEIPPFTVEMGMLLSLTPILQLITPEIDEVEQRLNRHVMTYHQLPRLYQPLIRLCQTIEQQVAQETEPLLQWTGQADPHGRAMAASDQAPHMAEPCAIYDDYFQVRRTYPITGAQFIGQVFGCIRRVLLDLPFTQLDYHQLINFTSTIKMMTFVLSTRLPANTPSLDYQTDNSVTESYQAAWQQATEQLEQLESWSQKVAFYRWRVGHHFFNLCTIFCRDLLANAEISLLNGQVKMGATYLHQARHCLMGTTFAIWYASNFSPHLYETVVRPSMVMPNSSSGFSGDQNADYNRLKKTKKQLKTYLKQTYHGKLAQNEPMLYRAWADFQEADIQDKEQHLVLVASKVGTAQSLSQALWQKELPADIPRVSAVAILREMLEAQRREANS